MSDRIDEFEQWLHRLELADESAISAVVDAYYHRLVRLAQKRLMPMPPQVADEEGAVVSALRSFFSGVQQGQFPAIRNEVDLWRVLATITARKAIRQLRVHWKQSGEADHVDRAHDIEALLSKSPSPEDEAVFADECRRCMDLLPDETLRKIAWLRLEGASATAIADETGIHLRSVQRKLKLIKTLWAEALTSH